MSAVLIKQLRAASGAPMLDCAKAVAASDGDLGEALTWLRKKGLSRVAKLADRVANAGLVGFRSSGTTGVLVEVNSETDFVARNDMFQQFVGSLSLAALDAAPSLSLVPSHADGAARATAEALAGLEIDYRGARLAASEAALDLSATLGEKIELSRLSILTATVVGGYAHNIVGPGLGLAGSMVALRAGPLSESQSEDLHTAAKRIAMHIVAAKPGYLDPSLVSQEDLDKERGIALEQLKDSGKAAEMMEKIAAARLAKFINERSLRTQIHMVEDSKKSVADVVKMHQKALGLDQLEVAAFTLFSVGEL
ncbi:elongation factor TS-domain-containing protein [Pelagophyceae sp. CCMP2097]|nr:elongation factor TS-domain-containing protein [Pelagophyceae sp. CCMP2097]|eukprot:CAMPEP_0184105654 /NCGR_PEP_ID=MMETSP0974-20121125/14982_1 /TAXON_ID=483370 /ORGANISM="non described non described, Strain CCMP2097" /LENGTH=308 /DNA_ID=CAMNT_0026408665 /DNA_START=13 /DNA_END=939 /DNA_ORIENTATION=-